MNMKVNNNKTNNNSMNNNNKAASNASEINYRHSYNDYNSGNKNFFFIK